MDRFTFSSSLLQSIADVFNLNNDQIYCIDSVNNVSVSCEFLRMNLWPCEKESQLVDASGMAITEEMSEHEDTANKNFNINKFKVNLFNYIDDGISDTCSQEKKMKQM